MSFRKKFDTQYEIRKSNMKLLRQDNVGLDYFFPDKCIDEREKYAESVLVLYDYDYKLQFQGIEERLINT